jgi:hypothetical protein
MTPAPDPITPPMLTDSGALLRRSVSVIVGTRDAGNRPHVVRALGYRVHPSGAPTNGLTIFLDRAVAEPVVADVRDNGQVAVVFSEPSTHKTVQFKSASARIEPQQPGDAALVLDYVERIVIEICSLGYPSEVIAGMFAHQPDSLINLSFVPDQAFDQTPGALAGQPLQR